MDAVWICERIQPGALSELNPRTAGAISKRLLALSQSLDDDEGKNDVLDGATRFADLVLDRINLLHGRPGTNQSDGMAKLFRAGQPFTVQQIEEVADKFSEYSLFLSECFHGYLKELFKAAM